MGLLDKYKVMAKPPKLKKSRQKLDNMVKVNKKFLAGLQKQAKLAEAWKPGAKDMRSWVTRNIHSNQAWVTVKYGARAVTLKGRKATLGPVALDRVGTVFDDIRPAHAAGELDAGLKKAAVLGSRKKKDG